MPRRWLPVPGLRLTSFVIVLRGVNCKKVKSSRCKVRPIGDTGYMEWQRSRVSGTQGSYYRKNWTIWGIGRQRKCITGWKVISPNPLAVGRKNNARTYKRTHTRICYTHSVQLTRARKHVYVCMCVRSYNPEWSHDVGRAEREGEWVNVTPIKSLPAVLLAAAAAAAAEPERAFLFIFIA